MKKTPTSSEVRGTSVLILGYGREGKSVHAWLRKHYPAVSVAVADARQIPKEERKEGATWHCGTHYLGHISEYDTVIRSPGVSPFLPEIDSFVKNGGHITSATNIFLSQCPGKVIGITGTKGKSTTAALIFHILSQSRRDVRLVGNIGNPMLDHLEGATPQTIFVTEFSSHQLYDIRFGPHVAVILPIAPEHQDYYPDVGTYAAAKANITKHQTKKDQVVYDESDTQIQNMLRGAVGLKHLYTTGTQSSSIARFVDDSLTVQGKVVVEKSSLSIYGNNHSVLAASVVSVIMGVRVAVIRKALISFVPLPHRLEFVGEYGRARYFNDSLATIPEATVHALDALGPDVSTLIAGGFDRGLSQDVLAARLAKSKVKSLILFPDTGEKIWKALKAVDSKTSIQKHSVQSMEEAVRLAAAHTPRGKICLLSPAAASFNLFRDYKDRGEQFVRWAKKLPKT